MCKQLCVTMTNIRVHCEGGTGVGIGRGRERGKGEREGGETGRGEREGGERGREWREGGKEGEGGRGAREGVYSVVETLTIVSILSMEKHILVNLFTYFPLPHH